MQSYTGAVSCVFLAVQFSMFALARTRLRRGACDAAILGISEVLKLVVSAAMAARPDAQKARAALKEPGQWARAAVPAACFAAMNTISMWCAQYMDAATFSVVAQSKLLWTALFRLLLLRKGVSRQRALALVAIWLGCTTCVAAAPGEAGRSARAEAICFLVLECAISGVAACLTERLFEGNEQLMWGRNVQLAALSALFFFAKSAHAACKWDEFIISDAAVAVLGALGGILVALATLHAGSVHKAIATSSSIIIVVAAEMTLFPKEANLIRALSAASIANAVVLYSTQ